MNISGYDYIRFESDAPIWALDRITYYGYTHNTVLVDNLVSNKNFYCFWNLFLKSYSLLYTDNLATQYINSTELSCLKNASSNLQTQINNIAASSDLSNHDTSTMVKK